MKKNETKLYDEETIVKLGFVAIGTYIYFAYTFNPPEYLRNLIHDAANCLKWIYLSMKWDQLPIFHFLTSHAIFFTSVDKNSYITLQEGTEEKNLEIKTLVKEIFKGTKWVFETPKEIKFEIYGSFG